MIKFINKMKPNRSMNKRGAIISSFSYFDSDYRRDIFLRALERRHEGGKINKKDFIKYKQSPETFEEIKTALLGEQFKMTGRVKKNTFSNKLEFTANEVNPADPKEELERMKQIQ